MKTYLRVIYLMLFIITSGSSLTFAAQITAEEIVQKSLDQDDGYHAVQVNLEMILKNAENQTSTRYMKIKSLEVSDDGDKLLVIFNRPRDIKGTAFLTYTHRTGSDDQWLYLPSIKRVKRVSSNNKSGPFMGGEFAYEDLVSEEMEKYHFFD